MIGLPIKRALWTGTWLVIMAVAGQYLYERVVAQPDIGPGRRAQAALAYDDGKTKYCAGKYREAMLDFLAADNLAPSKEALVQATFSALREDLWDDALDMILQLRIRYSRHKFKVPDNPIPENPF